MPMTSHIEKHFTAGETIRDIVIGMSDGLTVPFALAAGLTGAISETRLSWRSLSPVGLGEDRAPFCIEQVSRVPQNVSH